MAEIIRGMRERKIVAPPGSINSEARTDLRRVPKQPCSRHECGSASQKFHIESTARRMTSAEKAGA